jgi:predicted  nucleic acid-binding Zn-ribbon protein
LASRKKRLRAPSTRSQFTAVLEAIEQQNRLVMEAADSHRAVLERQIGELRGEMNARFETLEAAILELGRRVAALEARVSAVERRMEALEGRMDTLEASVRKNSDDIQRLREQLAELTGVVRGKAEAKDVAALAERVARLEARIGL